LHWSVFSIGSKGDRFSLRALEILSCRDDRLFTSRRGQEVRVIRWRTDLESQLEDSGLGYRRYMKRMPRIFENLARFFHLESWFRLLLLCVLVGVVSGIGAYGFEYMLRLLAQVMLDNFLFKNVDAGRHYWLLMAVPAAGGALAGALGLWLAPEAVGHGTDAVIRAFHRNRGEIRARVPATRPPARYWPRRDRQPHTQRRDALTPPLRHHVSQPQRRL
jgi:hypothetical protein